MYSVGESMLSTARVQHFSGLSVLRQIVTFFRIHHIKGVKYQAYLVVVCHLADNQEMLLLKLQVLILCIIIHLKPSLASCPAGFRYEHFP